MTNHQNGPPGLEVGPRPGHHPRTEDTDTNNTSSHDTAKADSICRTGRCAIGEPCRCDFYADWQVCWPPLWSLSGQLRRRRVAAHRSPRLTCGRRDPISESIS